MVYESFLYGENIGSKVPHFLLASCDDASRAFSQQCYTKSPKGFYRGRGSFCVVGGPGSLILVIIRNLKVQKKKTFGNVITC